jgi:hypothetical protein
VPEIRAHLSTPSGPSSISTYSLSRADFSRLIKIMNEHAGQNIAMRAHNALNSACVGAVAWHLLARL